jgi:hypothetical protein
MPSAQACNCFVPDRSKRVISRIACYRWRAMALYLRWAVCCAGPLRNGCLLQLSQTHRGSFRPPPVLRNASLWIEMQATHRAASGITSVRALTNCVSKWSGDASLAVCAARAAGPGGESARRAPPARAQERNASGVRPGACPRWGREAATDAARE